MHSMKQGDGAVDIQRKKGLLDICVLSVLSREPSYGYKIVGDVSACIDISESTLYPILKRLESAGCLTTFTQEHNGRMRKYYRITETGVERIRAFLDEWEEMRRVYAFIESNGRRGYSPPSEKVIIAAGKEGI